LSQIVVHEIINSLYFFDSAPYVPSKDITRDYVLLCIQVYSPGDYLIHVSSQTPFFFSYLDLLPVFLPHSLSVSFICPYYNYTTLPVPSHHIK
jgi:hypothetical protein